MSRLAGKKVFVTGGGRGIGRAITLELAAAGAHVGILYRNDREAAEATAAEAGAQGGKVLTFKGDVTKRDEVEAAMGDMVARCGKLDVLVNNAGINKPTDFDQITDADWDDILGVNLKGPFICSQVALPLMNDGGSIVMIGSVSGQYGGPRTAHYAASKAGLISLGQVIARFGAARGIRCNTIAAGLIASDMAEAGLQNEAVRKAAEGIPLKKLGSPRDVAEAVVFLAGDSSSYITAQTLNVNGGLYF